MNQHNFHKLISGQSVGLTATTLRFSLGVAAAGYSLAVILRNFLYSKRWLKIYTADAPVISIGNITTGGTGKTPLVIWLCKFLQQKDLRCAVLTRGYKTTQNLKLKTQNYVDEPAILAESCPQAKIIINPNRIEAAAEAVNKFGAKVLIMDDGFQHRRLHRNLDIVTIDATCPFGYGKLLPAGLLREPVASLKRADAAVLTRCDQISESELNQIEKELQLINPDMVITRSIHSPVCVKSTAGEKIGLEQLRNRKIFAFCGIGNPETFLSTIKNTGANPVGSKIYNDHYHYTNSDADDIHDQARYLKADLILTTQKDWTRTTLLTSVKKDIPFAYLAVEIKFIAGEDKLKQLIEDTLAGKILKTEED
ncbi:MAG: tetraacyldisaccharide 4'-kinase [Sedimentisphaerales bacterium]